jgi:putative ABC transport system permease protein
VLRLALRGFAAHKLRQLSITFAVFLGVALVAGTYILTDTINSSFDDLFSTSLKGTDVVITPREIVSSDNDDPPAFPSSVLAKVARVPGVAKAVGSVGTMARLVDAKGKKLGNGFAPNFLFSASPPPFQEVTYKKGHPPRTARDAALDADTADRAGLGIGDTLGVTGDTSVRHYRIVGLYRLGNASTGGSASASLILPEAQAVTDRRGRFDQISIKAAQGVTPAQLKLRVEKVVPRALRVESGSQSAARQASDVNDNLSFFRVALLVLSGVVLIVAAFLIFNTFSITVAQRVREFGLLRTLGASRRQVLSTVVGEAAVIGVTGAGLGLVAGIGAATGLRSMLKAVGIDLPYSGNVFHARTAIVAVVLGIVVPLVAALTPALRATRVAPMAALRQAELPEGRERSWKIALFSGLLALLGIFLLVLGLFGGLESSSNAASAVGGGSAAVLFAVSLYSPRLVRPLAAIAGWPMERLRGVTGRLARENAMRKPGRTAVTAAALMIGLALVTFVSVFAAGLKGSIENAIDSTVQGDLTVQNTDGFSPIPASIAGDLRRVPGVGRVATLRSGNARVAGQKSKSERISGVDPKAITGLYKFEIKQGPATVIRDLTDDEVVVDRSWAKPKKIGVGDTIRTLSPTGRHSRFKVVGELQDNADALGAFVVTQHVLARDFGVKRDTFDYVKFAPGAQAKPVAARVKALTKRRYPSAEALNRTDYKKKQTDQFAPILGLLYGLLSLAVIVSIFGLVNTLALSIHERAREFGMLRAIGLSRKQLRRVIRYESVITAQIGAILGVALGVLFAALISRPLADQGFTLAYPIGTLVLLFVLAGLAGVLAAIFPARNAAKRDVLESVAYE